MIGRRGFLLGAGALIAAPAVIRTPGLLMPIKPFDEADILDDYFEHVYRRGMILDVGLYSGIAFGQLDAMTTRELETMSQSMYAVRAAHAPEPTLSGYFWQPNLITKADLKKISC